MRYRESVSIFRLFSCLSHTLSLMSCSRTFQRSAMCLLWPGIFPCAHESLASWPRATTSALGNERCGRCRITDGSGLLRSPQHESPSCCGRGGCERERDKGERNKGERERERQGRDKLAIWDLFSGPRPAYSLCTSTRIRSRHECSRWTRDSFGPADQTCQAQSRYPEVQKMSRKP